MEGQQLGPGGTYAGDQSSGVTRHDLVYLRKDSDLQMPEVCPFLPSALTPPRGISPLIWTAGQPPWLPTCCPHLRWTHTPHRPQSLLHLKSKPATPWAEPGVACLPFSQAAFRSQLEQTFSGRCSSASLARTSAVWHAPLTPGALPSPQVPDDDVHWSLLFQINIHLPYQSPRDQGCRAWAHV